jgi:hypothetical protein
MLLPRRVLFRLLLTVFFFLFFDLLSLFLLITVGEAVVSNNG